MRITEVAKTSIYTQRKFISILLFWSLSMPFYAQSTVTKSDSMHIKPVKILQEIVVLAPNMERTNNYILIRPTSNQRKHSINAFELLQSSSIPGVDIDVQNGIVNAMGAHAALYINGQECDARDLLMLRPKDIEKIEYHDIPTGKYAKDRVAVNFVLKQYRYGGYVWAEASQYTGYNKGIYDASASISHGQDTYSLFTGLEYSQVRHDDEETKELFDFSTPLSRQKISQASSKLDDKYLQLRYQHQSPKNYIITKISLLDNNMPYKQTSGNVFSTTSNRFDSRISQKGLSPKLDFNGEVKFDARQSLDYGLHFTFDRNKYSHQYDEGTYSNSIDESENVYSFKAACIYTLSLKNSTFTGELFHYHNIWSSNYSGESVLWQHLWKGESLGFLSYNQQLGSKINLQARLGIDWLRYSLHGVTDFEQVTPRINLSLQYQIPRGNLLYSFNYVNPNYGMDVINRARVDEDNYISLEGNPDLKKGSDIITYLYYSQQFSKFSVSAFSEYDFSHHYVTDNYTIENEHLLQSFINDGNTHQVSNIFGLSYGITSRINASGDLRYTYSFLDGDENLHNSNLSGNVNMQFYWKDLSIKPSLNLGQKTLDFRTMTLEKIPVNYSLNLSYAHKNLYLSAYINSPFTDRHIKQRISTRAYSLYRDLYSKTTSQYCCVSLPYTLDFGRKTKKIETDIDRDNNSSLLQIL